MNPHKLNRGLAALVKFLQKTSPNFRLLLILFLFLPGQNYYQTLEPKLGKPLVRSAKINLPPLPDYPLNHEELLPPVLTSRAALVMDLPSGITLYQKNPKARVLPASTTKIMTAMVVLENFSLEQVVQVEKLDEFDWQKMGLVEGEKITVENLLYGLLVQSGNDAAEVLAKAFPGGRESFIQKMNEALENLDLKDTHFTNPTGVEEENHYTTAFDLIQITREALKKPTFAKMVATKRISVSDIEGINWHHLENINYLLDDLLGMKGVKTGWTENAGECLVAYFEIDKRRLITVVLGSGDRFGETKKLVNWVFENFSWEKIIPEPIED